MKTDPQNAAFMQNYMHPEKRESLIDEIAYRHDPHAFSGQRLPRLYRDEKQEARDFAAWAIGRVMDAMSRGKA